MARWGHPYYLLHLALFASYALLRQQFVLRVAQGGPKLGRVGTLDELGSWERQAVGSMAIVLVWKFLRMRSPEHYAHITFFYLKALLLVMAYVLDARACVWYALAAWALEAVCSQPMFDLTHSDHMTSLTPQRLKDVIRETTGAPPTTWLVYCFTEHHSASKAMAAVVADIAEKHASERLRFGYIDACLWPRTARELGFGAAPSWSNQLPCVVRFEGGKETGRVPAAAATEDYFKVNHWTRRDLVKEFGLGAAAPSAEAAAKRAGGGGKKAR